jgi:hypothetical protein
VSSRGRGTIPAINRAMICLFRPVGEQVSHTRTRIPESAPPVQCREPHICDFRLQWKKLALKSQTIAGRRDEVFLFSKVLPEGESLETRRWRLAKHRGHAEI